jgi:nucleoid DNA-binding protein
VAVQIKKSARSALRGVVAKPGARATVALKHLAANLSESHEMSKKQTEALLGELVDLVTKHLKKRIRIGGLSVLPVRKGARHVGRNPATSKVIQIHAEMKGSGQMKVEAKAAPNLLAGEPAENAYAPSARAMALLRGKEIVESDLKESGGSYTLQHVETLLGISRQAINDRVRDGTLLAVPGPHGRRRYPVVQFTADGTLPGLEDVLKSLPSANGWFRLNFLIRPDARLGGRRPIDLLRESKIDPVVMAAAAVGVQGA